MIIWFGLVCFVVGIAVGIWYERAGWSARLRFRFSTEEEMDEQIEMLRQTLRRELMDGFSDQEDTDLAG